MSILTTFEAMPNRMRDIFTYVYKNKTSIEKGELRQIFMPPSKRKKMKALRYSTVH